MKRRNVDSLKVRRPVKKIPKIYDGFYTSVVVYVKLLLLWICVMGGDFILEFRLEYLYPIYLLLQNSYEAYKFQGVAFALLMGCAVVSVDVICLGVIPGPWLYLLGSLAVWSHVGWLMAPLGPLILLPTLIYIDGKSIRPLPSQSLSPLAAHCVGFPLVSLGFGLKSFVGSRLKQRTRNDVGRQNELLYSLLWDALPYTSPPPPIENHEVIQNGGGPLAITKKPSTPLSLVRRKSVEVGDESSGAASAAARALMVSSTPLLSNNNSSHHTNSSVSNGGPGGLGLSLFSTSSSSSPASSTSSSGYSSNSPTSSSNHVLISHNNNVSLSPSNSTNFLSLMSNGATSPTSSSSLLSSSSGASSSVPLLTNGLNPSGQSCSCMMTPTPPPAPIKKKKEKDDCCFKLESEVRKLRSDLHSFKAIESDLKGQISVLHSSERNLRNDIASLQGEHESLQLKYSALVSKSQEERQSYEKKLSEERKAKDNAISKQKKALSDCSGDCKKKLRDAEREKENFRREIKVNEDKIVRIERELQNVKSTLLHEQKNKEVNQLPSQETTKLRSLLTNLQDQNALLESSLTAETRLKLDLFSALGEARRQLSIRDAMIKAKEEELDEVRGQLIDILAVTDFSPHSHNLTSSSNASSPQLQQQQQQQQSSSSSQQLYQRMNSMNSPVVKQQQQQQSSSSCTSNNSIMNNHYSLGNSCSNNNNNNNHIGHGPIGSIPLGVSVSCHNNYISPSSPLLGNGNGCGGLLQQQQQQQPPTNPHGTIGSGVVNLNGIGMVSQQQHHHHQQQQQHPPSSPGNENNLNFSSLIES